MSVRCCKILLVQVNFLSIKTGDIARILKEGFDFDLLRDGFYELIDELKLDYLLLIPTQV